IQTAGTETRPVTSRASTSKPPVRATRSAELRKHGILISMSGKGNCYDNAMVETFFKTLKSELVWRTMFETRQDAEQAIGRYIDGFYNPVRRHSALDFTSPAQFERMAAN
ncbi:IS3 family transposase, partial [Teichococcus wenyumeiae]|uniref:IS3 family transposase n=1 Tax=Teichococcus wenyumeiae TaxID=2478470 RepID=UPI001F287804